MGNIAQWFDLAVQGGEQISFWSTPLGIAISGVVFVCSMANVLHPGVDDNILDRAYYSIMSVLFLIALIIGITNEPSKDLVKWMLIALAVRFPLSLLMRHQRWVKTGQPQPTCTPSRKAGAKK